MDSIVLGILFGFVLVVGLGMVFWGLMTLISPEDDDWDDDFFWDD